MHWRPTDIPSHLGHQKYHLWSCFKKHQNYSRLRRNLKCKPQPSESNSDLTWRGQQAGRHVQAYKHTSWIQHPHCRTAIIWVTHHIIHVIVRQLIFLLSIWEQLMRLLAPRKHNFPADIVTQVEDEILGQTEETHLITGHFQGPDTKLNAASAPLRCCGPSWVSES